MIAKLNGKRLLLLAALPALMLASCSQEEIGGTDGGGDRVPVTFTTAIQGIALPQGNNPAGGKPGTRTAIDPTTGETVWATGDAVGIFMVTAGGKVDSDILPGATNKKYLVNPATGKLSPADGKHLCFPDDGSAVDFIAYYPYTPGYNPADGTLNGLFHVPAENQQNPAAIDVLWARVDGKDKSSTSVAFDFAHAMCKLTLNVKAGTGVTADEIRALTAQEVTFETVHVLPIDMNTSKVYAGRGGQLHTNVTLYKSPATAPGADATFSALITPLQDAADLTVVFLVGGREYRCTLPTADLAAGRHLVYPVTVRRTGIEVGAPATDVPWNEAELPTVEIDGKEFRLIRHADDLKRFADDVNSGQSNLNALQTADIDLGGFNNWVPINRGYNYNSEPFTGIYNGNGYTISRLTIHSQADGKYTGLFGLIGNGALLTGIHLRDVRITGEPGNYVGAIAGWVDEGATVTLCSARGEIDVSASGSLYVGGLAGVNCGAITRCRTDVAVTADATLPGQLSAHAGGITGTNEAGGLLFVCHATGPVTLTARHGDIPDGHSTVYAGGIAGANSGLVASSVNIYCCIAEGDVSATCETAGVPVCAGGLAGHQINGNIGSSYARGTAVAQGGEGTYARVAAGAIVGYKSNGVVSHCYGAGADDMGTSNIYPNTGLIVYNTNPQHGNILNILKWRDISVDNVPLTEYRPDRTPAYDIRIVTPRVNTSNYWLQGDGTWPALDFMRNQ